LSKVRLGKHVCMDLIEV